MMIRPLLILTGLVSAILGAIVVYLVLSVPNDLRADSLLKDARKDLEAKQNDDARKKLVSVVQSYPRTDAAAAATVALVTLANSEQQQLARELTLVRAQNAQQTRLITDLQKSVTAIQNKPAPVVTVQAPAPAPKPAAKKPPPAKKKTTPKKPTTKRRRR